MVGWKPKYVDARVASTRYRCLNPLRELQARGIPVELYDPRHRSQYEAVILSKLYDDEHLALARWLKDRGKPVIFDICDNHFYNPYGLTTFARIRAQLLAMLGTADVVVASTEALAGVLVQEAGLAASPVVIGDAIEEADTTGSGRTAWTRFIEHVRGRPGKTGRIELLWFGIHGGDNAEYGMRDLLTQEARLVALSRQYPLRLTVLSNSRTKYNRYIRPWPFETQYHEWGARPLARCVAEADITIIPITKNPFTWCKSNNRLATALFAGTPTVADEIPSYRDLAPFCMLDNWEEGLVTYLEKPDVARGQAARAKPYIKAQYGMARIGDLWERVLLRVVTPARHERQPKGATA